jgi:putative hydrolase of the HAD superfamily
MQRMSPIIDLSNIDAILLDMDGTLLDLHYDNHFWLHHLPQRYGQLVNIPHDQAKHKLDKAYETLSGKLDWYCLDYWQQFLGIDIIKLKREVAHLIGIHPGVERFLQLMRDQEKKLYILTNAHQGSLDLKLEYTGIEKYFDGLISSHDYGAPKEEQAFWQQFFRRHPQLSKERCLFIDDNQHVLDSAHQFGVGHLLAISQPDSQRPQNTIQRHSSVASFAQLLENLG